MNVNFPYQVRAAIYIVVVIGTAVLVPLNLNHIVSDVFMAVWTSVAGAASGLAALHVTPDTDK